MFWIILAAVIYFYRTGPGFNLICNLRRFYLTERQRTGFFWLEKRRILRNKYMRQGVLYLLLQRQEENCIALWQRELR